MQVGAATLEREMAGRDAEIRLVGGGGEPVDLLRTIASHGVADLPPNRIDEEARTLELTLPVAGAAPRTVRISPGRRGYARMEVLGSPLPAGRLARLRGTVEHVL